MKISNNPVLMDQVRKYCDHLNRTKQHEESSTLINVMVWDDVLELRDFVEGHVNRCDGHNKYVLERMQNEMKRLG